MDIAKLFLLVAILLSAVSLLLLSSFDSHEDKLGLASSSHTAAALSLGLSGTTTTSLAPKPIAAINCQQDPNSNYANHQCHSLDQLETLMERGHWEQDWAFAQHYGQYPQPFVIQRGGFIQRTWGRFRPSPQAPVPWETSWKYVLGNPSLENQNETNQQSCQLDYTMDASSMCRLLTQLQIHRILFFGDSTSGMQYKALLNKLGPKHVQVTGKFTATLECPTSTTTARHGHLDTTNTVDIRYAKEGGGNDVPGSPLKVMKISEPTLNFIMDRNSTMNRNSSSSSSKNGDNQKARLLAIFNIGAHYHQLNHFQHDFDKLQQWILSGYDGDTMTRTRTPIKPQNRMVMIQPHDVIFYRTSVSGHEGCEPRNPRTFNFTAGIRTVPLQRYQDFQQSTQYEWNLLDHYNHYAKQRIQQAISATEEALAVVQPVVSKKQPTIRLLDVVNMTVLRQDGHTGGKDCLHYVSPGPVDWWNHFLFTKLKIMQAVEEKDSRQGNCVSSPAAARQRP